MYSPVLCMGSNWNKFTSPYCRPYISHVTYRWAVKLFPFIPSSLLIKSLAMALRARELDMRASPYDLTTYFPPWSPRRATTRSREKRGSESSFQGGNAKEGVGGKGGKCTGNSRADLTNTQIPCGLNDVAAEGLGGTFSSEPIYIETVEVSFIPCN